MLTALWVVSAIFLMVGFVVTEKNASSVLAGYNSMSEEEKKKIDLKKLLKTFKAFHVFLASSLLLIGMGFYLLNLEKYLEFLLVLYPLMAYIWLIWKINSGKFKKIEE